MLSKISQKSPQVVKHVVKGEKWACSTLETGKNKPVMFIAKTRDFASICEKIKEKRGFVMNPRFGLNRKHLSEIAISRHFSYYYVIGTFFFKAEILGIFVVQRAFAASGKAFSSDSETREKRLKSPKRCQKTP